MHAAECSTCRSQESVLTYPGSHALESSRREHGAKTKSENIITVKKLAKSFWKVKAVRGVSFEVKKGEIFGLLRPNGAGKTTTLEMMEGLRKSDSGTIIVADVNVGEDMSKVKSHIGVQLQSSSFFANLKGVQP
jgi:ABC-type multidrug transport system ATPase subunit